MTFFVFFISLCRKIAEWSLGPSLGRYTEPKSVTKIFCIKLDIYQSRNSSFNAELISLLTFNTQQSPYIQKSVPSVNPSHPSKSPFAFISHPLSFVQSRFNVTPRVIPNSLKLSHVTRLQALHTRIVYT